jgi:hypothetical protein
MKMLLHAATLLLMSFPVSAIAAFSLGQDNELFTGRAGPAQIDCRSDIAEMSSLASDVPRAGGEHNQLSASDKHPHFASFQLESKQAQLFAQAKRRTSTQFEELALPDGRKMTKVSGQFGTYCVYKESVALTKGRDQITAGVRTMVTACP